MTWFAVHVSCLAEAHSSIHRLLPVWLCELKLITEAVKAEKRKQEEERKKQGKKKKRKRDRDDNVLRPHM